MDDQGYPVEDDSLLLNPHDEPIEFWLPDSRPNRQWELIVRTDQPESEEGHASWQAGAPLDLPPRTVVLLRLAD